MIKNEMREMLNDICCDIVIYFLLPGGRTRINEQTLIADLSETLKLLDGDFRGYITRRTSRDTRIELKNLHPAVVKWLEMRNSKMSYTCKDCRHRGSCPDGSEIMPFPEMEICINFETEDGKRPRFCRLAGSVDEMAKQMVFERQFEGEPPEWFFVKDENFNIGGSKHEAIAAAKAWLMEVEG